MAERERFCIDDAEVLKLADYAHPHRGALFRDRAGHADAHGHRMGQGRRRRRALHRAGATRDRGLAKRRGRLRNLPAAGQRTGAARRPRRGREDRQRRRCASSPIPRIWRLPCRRRAGRRDDQSRLGAGHEEGRRHRHRPRRAHLPRRHRRARARHPRRRRHAAMRRAVLSTTAHGHRLLRRGRHRPRLSPGKLPFEIVDASTWRRLGRPHTADHGQSRQPRSGLQDRACCPNDGVGLARMEFIISEHIGVHPMALVHARKR